MAPRSSPASVLLTGTNQFKFAFDYNLLSAVVGQYGDYNSGDYYENPGDYYSRLLR